MARKARKGEETCRCNAYPFPHRRTGGDCDGSYYCRECGCREWRKVRSGYNDELGAWAEYECPGCGHREDTI